MLLLLLLVLLLPTTTTITCILLFLLLHTHSVNLTRIFDVLSSSQHRWPHGSNRTYRLGDLLSVDLGCDSTSECECCLAVWC